jgi:putative transposase
LDLYFSGLSLRKVSRNINDHFGIDMNFSTLYTWIQKYIPQISNYVNSLTPQLSDSWHIDELFVKMKGGDKRKGNTNVAYLWNIMDREGNKVEHIAKCGITKPHANNNRVERLNGTLRERVKVQRGWKTHKSAISEGQRIYYNFVKPHQSLDEKTPAEQCGIKEKCHNKWITLIENAQNG